MYEVGYDALNAKINKNTRNSSHRSGKRYSSALLLRIFMICHVEAAKFLYRRRLLSSLIMVARITDSKSHMTVKFYQTQQKINTEISRTLFLCKSNFRNSKKYETGLSDVFSLHCYKILGQKLFYL